MKQYSLVPDFSDEVFSERFNQMDDFFSKLTGKFPVSNIPNYDIKKTEDNEFIVTVSVPGYSESDLEITTRNKQLIIKGKKQEEKNFNKKYNFIYRSIFQRNFVLKFNIGDDIKIINAKLKDGLLNINLKQEVPEEEKIQKITINS